MRPGRTVYLFSGGSLANRRSDGIDRDPFATGLSAVRIRVARHATSHSAGFPRDEYHPGKKTRDVGITVEYSAWSRANFFRQINRRTFPGGDHPCDEPSGSERLLCDGWLVALW